jgi:hypothetical protein
MAGKGVFLDAEKRGGLVWGGTSRLCQVPPSSMGCIQADSSVSLI